MAGGKAVSKAAEGVIAKALKDLVRDAEKGVGKDAAKGAEKAGAKDLGGQSAKQAEERAGREAAARAEARRTCGDPVDVATGDVVLTQLDVELPGTLPLVLARTHVSSYRNGRLFGPSWASTLDQRLEVSAGGVQYFGEDGMELRYPLPQPGAQSLPVAGPRWTLTNIGGGDWSVTDPDTGAVRWFTRPDSSYTASVPLTSVVDRTGTYRYDVSWSDAGIPVTVRHSGGYEIAIDTDGSHVTGLRMVAGNVPLVRFAYEGDRLGAVVNSSGQALGLAYDDDGRLALWQDRNGVSYAYDYDGAGRCIRAGGPSRHMAARFDYGDGRQTTYLDSLGHRTVFELNELGQIERETDPLGHSVTNVWDDADRLLARTDELGNTTTYRYSDADDLVGIDRPGSRSTSAQYNGRHQPTLVVDADGARTVTEYDPVGRVLSVTGPDGARTAYGYAEGRLVAMTDAAGRRQGVTLDAAGLLTSLRYPDGTVSQYQRDVFGRVVAESDPLGNTVRYTWTVEGRLAARVLPDGSIEQWSYDGEGNEVAHTDMLGQTTRTSYGPFDLPIASTRPDGTRVQYTHDTELRLTGVTGADGRTWSYGWDEAGRLVRERDFAGRTVEYSYDASGKLVRRTSAAGPVDFRRDAAGNVLELRRGPDEVLTFTRDRAGRIVEATGPRTQLARTYDAAGRVRTETVDGRTLAFEYDALGRRTTRRTPAGVTSVLQYDAAQDEPAALHTAGRTVAFGYDAAGHEVARRIGADVLLSQTWDTNSRLRGRAVTARGRTGAVVDRRYGYRADGVPTSVDGPAGRSEYALDAAGRVTAVSAARWNERYAYDASGALTSANGENLSYVEGQVASAGRTRYEYDAAGRMTRRTQRTLSGQVRTWRYAWNADDQLIALLTPDGTQWRYRYDPLGRRTAKERLGAAGEVVERTAFCWDGTRLIEESGPTGSTTWEYRFGTYEPLAQVDSGPLDQAEVDRRFYAIVTDLVGAPTELVDDAGTLVWQQRSTLWGIATGGGSGSVRCPLRFPGQYFDAESGLHHNLARSYDPEIGQYVSPDPLGLVGGPDPTAYVPNPTCWVDPLGLMGCKPGKGNRGKAAQDIPRANPKTVYRQLNGTDAERLADGKGLVGKGKGGSIRDHVKGEDTSHISASVRRGDADRFDGGNGLVAIDVDAAQAGGANFIGHWSVISAVKGDSRLTNFASRASEVLFDGEIPFSAITVLKGGT